MKTKRLGSGLTVSAVGLGCMALTEQHYGPVDEAESVRTVHSALDQGLTLFDTAETYGFDHANEKLLGRALRGRRDEAIVTTKFGLTFDPATGSTILGGHPDTIRDSCEQSLRRLETDHIDIYYQHRVNPEYPIEDVWGILAELVEQGKVRHLGMSEPGLDTLKRAHAIHPVTAVQNEYSLFTRDPEHDLLPLLRDLEIGLVSYAPIGRGFLSGAFRSPEDFPKDDFRRRLPRFQGENFVANLALVDAVGGVARSLGVSPIQLALAWVLSRGEDVVPIPGMETREMLAENLGALDFVLEADHLEALESAIPKGAVGERYGAGIGSLSAADSAKT